MKPTQNPERVLSFTEHLEELRIRIIVCVVFFIAALLISFFFAPRVVEFLIAPLVNLQPTKIERVLTLQMQPDGLLRIVPSADLPGQTTQSREIVLAADKLLIRDAEGKDAIHVGGKQSSSLFFLSPLEPFMLWLQGALLLSAMVSIPVAIHQLWLFISPGLLKKEQRMVKPLLLASVLLFPMGAMFAYLISKFALQFLLSFGDDIPGLQPNIVASKYLHLILVMMLSFGLVFEFPLVLLLLSRVGLIDSTFLVKRRKPAIVIIAVLAAAITPSPDPFSMIAMLLPLLILYEGSIYVIRMLERRSPVEEMEETS